MLFMPTKPLGVQSMHLVPWFWAAVLYRSWSDGEVSEYDENGQKNRRGDVGEHTLVCRNQRYK